MKRTPAKSWQAHWNGVGLRVAVIAASVAAGSSIAAAPAAFQSMDANGDGRISSVEHSDAAKRMFDAMDADRNGKVTAAEMDAAHEKVTGMKAAAKDMGSAEKIRTIDTNADGILTAEEHAAGSKAMFEAMDANKDGSLTPAEFDAGHAKLLKKGAK